MLFFGENSLFYAKKCKIVIKETQEGLAPLMFYAECGREILGRGGSPKAALARSQASFFTPLAQDCSNSRQGDGLCS